MFLNPKKKLKYNDENTLNPKFMANQMDHPA